MMKGKRFSEMTEEEILDEALTAIRDNIHFAKASGTFNTEFFVARELDVIRKLFRNDRARWNAPLTPADQTEMDLTMAHFEPELIRRTLAFREKFLHERKISEINATTAEALINNRLGALGLEGSIKCGRYAASVEVLLGGSTFVRFRVNYKKMTDPRYMDDTFGALMNLKDAVSRLGLDVRIKTKRK